MSLEVKHKVSFLREMLSPNGKRYANIETNRGCNRSCSYCNVPQQYDRDQEATVAESLAQVDWVYQQGYRTLSFVGGEPLAPFKTREGITFAEHTKEVVRHASSKGMVMNVTTNGDFLSQKHLDDLKDAGLDVLTFSLHSFTEPGFRHILKGAKSAAHTGLIPVVNTVFTSRVGEHLPGIAATLAENGVLFSSTVVQEKGGGFSATPESSLVPTHEQKARVYGSLGRLKRYGFIRNNQNYLQEVPLYETNNWTCNAERDAFIHIGAGGRVNVCSEVRTDFTYDQIDLSSNTWRQTKRELVPNCGNCLYSCYFEAENPALAGDIPTLGVMLLIKSGHADMIERWGRFAVSRIKKTSSTINWELSFPQ